VLEPRAGGGAAVASFSSLYKNLIMSWEELISNSAFLACLPTECNYHIYKHYGKHDHN
jgi:hypothetical protein